MDILGQLLRHSPSFRGRGRLMHHWLNQARRTEIRQRNLWGGVSLPCDMAIPYEAMIWMCSEEERELRVLRRLLRPGDTFVDVGANVGLWTLTAASALQKEGRIVAIEPNPSTFRKLSANVDGNNLAGLVKVVNAACGAREGQVHFRCDAAHNISQVVADSSEHTALVQMQTLDVTTAGECVTGIKVDVEGHEEAALLGADAMLRRCRPWLCVEFNTVLAGVDQLRDWLVHQYLSELGYRCWQFLDAIHCSDLPEIRDDRCFKGYVNLFYCFGEVAS